MEPRDYLRHDALGLAELVASGDVTAAELLAAARARAEVVNPRVNAIVTRLDDVADERVAGELTGPFAGDPFLLKDLGQNLAGHPTSSGCRALAGRPATHTNTVVQRWLDAGLVIFGRTNTPEFGAKGITEPELFGPTRNPWDTDRIPGGSSGGSAPGAAAGTRLFLRIGRGGGRFGTAPPRAAADAECIRQEAAAGLRRLGRSLAQLPLQILDPGLGRGQRLLLHQHRLRHVIGRQRLVLNRPADEVLRFGVARLGVLLGLHLAQATEQVGQKRAFLGGHRRLLNMASIARGATPLHVESPSPAGQVPRRMSTPQEIVPSQNAAAVI